jgi:hypothetical protein
MIFTFLRHFEIKAQEFQGSWNDKTEKYQIDLDKLQARLSNATHQITALSKVKSWVNR